ncbi:FAD-dependent oxidoreductase [Candidatus Hydrogenedentota bacterium]
MQIVIVGAGLAGLTLAAKLSEKGITPVLIERENAVGGLARSFSYENGATFDMGPHRFHTDDPKVQRFVERTLAEDHIFITRNSQLFVFGKYIPWPIALKSLFQLPPGLFIRSGIDLFLPRKAKTDSFEDYVIEKYGKTLYNVFFKAYTEKFLEYTCSNLHSDWASTGINRATIDKKVNTSSLSGLIKSVLFSPKVDTKFIYPESGGIGVFAEKLARQIEERGGRIILSSQVSRLLSNGNKINGVVTDSGEEISAGHVFWSGSLQSLRSLGEAPDNVPQLHYMSTIFFNYLTSHQIDQGFQWCYFGDKNMEVDRICVPRNFSPALVPKGKEALCVEISSSEQSETWHDPARLDCVVETFLLRANLLKSLDSVIDYHVERVHETYPLYVLNYPRKLKIMFNWVNDTWGNMTLIGRTGRFWYNNMDHSIAASLDSAERFIEDYEKGALRNGETYSCEDRYLEK